MTAPAQALPVTYTDVQSAAQRLAGVAHRTPVMTSRTVDEMTGARVFFKCENFQRMGAFKFRGAYNALSRLSDDEKRRGVLAYSSGNHAQAVALAGQLLGIKTTIVMPEDAPAVKLEATRGYGAEVVTYNRQTQSREALSASIAADRGLTVIPPFNHPHVVAGQGTAALELIEETMGHGGLDWLFVCCGGAGLLSGCAIAAEHLVPHCKVVGVEPAAGDDATRSFRTRTLQTVRHPDTIADGARTESLGSITFPLMLAYVNDMMTVDDTELLAAMRLLWERLKIVVEPTGALAAAGVLKGQHPIRGTRVGVIVSGGNVDLRAIGLLMAPAPR